MTPEDQQLIMSWAAARGIPFIEDDIPFLHREISKLNVSVERWCELQDKQQEQINEKLRPNS
jgi:hypothetical protein